MDLSHRKFKLRQGEHVREEQQHNYIASIEGRNTTLCDIDNTASSGFIML
jgi:hypothetical protein